MSKLSHRLFERFDKRPSVYIICALVVYWFINNTINATSVWMEANRNGATPDMSLWEPFAWEYTSLLSNVLLLPLLIWWFNKLPFSLSHLLRFAFLTFLATVVYSALHVGIMVTLRELIYSVMGGNYDFGNVYIEFFYEYRKDAWGFIIFMAMYYIYRFIYKRLKGEASLIHEQLQDNNDSADFSHEPQANATAPEHLLVKKLDKEFLVKVADIEWLEAAGNYVNLHCGGRIYPLRSTLSGLLPNIAVRGFAQTHRSFGVNLNKIESISSLPSGDGEIHLLSGKSLALSRRYKESFKSRVSVQK
jgi:hypothetical protein